MPTVVTNSSPVTITGLTPETTYTFSIRAVNQVGKGAISNSSITPTNFPRNTSLPVISGSPYETLTLSVTNGSWSSVNLPGSYAYQWQRNGANIASATSNSYILTASDVGNVIRCIVTGTNGAFSNTATSANTSTISAQGNVTSVNYLVVAGGGGGGSYNPAGGGGGAGGYRTGSLSVSVGSTYTVTVGGGGSGAIDISSASSNATNSSFSTISATRGGYGGGGANPSTAQSGGSGGGCAPSGTRGTGNLGGYSPVEGYGGFQHVGINPGAATGGGGAGGEGGNVGSGGGAGGPGQGSSISGSYTEYAGGGGGGCSASYSGPGGSASSGGGAGGYGVNGTSGTAATGGGGGGGGSGSGGTARNGGSGGSGVVIVSYSAAFKAANTTTGSPSYTVSGGNHIYRWTGSGSIKF